MTQAENIENEKTTEIIYTQTQENKSKPPE